MGSFIYLKFFVSAMVTSLLLALVLFLYNARRRASAKAEEIPYRKLGKFMIIASIIFVLAVTPLSVDMADKRNPSPEEITYNGATAVEGFRVAIDYNCMGCHTIVGNGAYYAPDLNYIARRAGTAENIRALLETFVGSKYMPFNMTERQLDALTAWMLYLRDLNTNNWPPMPRVEIVEGAGTGAAVNETLQLGRQIYETNCASCHGADGRGVVPGTPDFTDPAWWDSMLATEGFEGLAAVVKNGKGAMPAFGNRLSDEEINAVLAYAQSLSGQTAQQPAEGKRLVFGGYSFEPSFEANKDRWYESMGAWYVYWVITVFFGTFLIYSFMYWYARG